MTRRTIALFLIAGLLVVSCGGPIAEVIVVEPFSYGGIVSIKAFDSGGSGFVIGDEGESYLVVTAAHVVDMDIVVSVDGTDGEVVAIDYETDIAIIRVPKIDQNWKVWSLADAEIEDKCRVAGFVYVNGFDKPLFVVYWGRVTSVDWTGMVSFNGGAFPGVSGGPLINENGEVLGICSCCTGAWGLPMETAALFSPSSNIRALLVTLNKMIVVPQPSGD